MTWSDSQKGTRLVSSIMAHTGWVLISISRETCKRQPQEILSGCGMAEADVQPLMYYDRHGQSPPLRSGSTFQPPASDHYAIFDLDERLPSRNAYVYSTHNHAAIGRMCCQGRARQRRRSNAGKAGHRGKRAGIDV